MSRSRRSGYRVAAGKIGRAAALAVALGATATACGEAEQQQTSTELAPGEAPLDVAARQAIEAERAEALRLEGIRKRNPVVPLTERPDIASELPDNYPPDLPRLPGIRVKLVRTAPDGSLSIGLVSDQGLEEVARFFADGFAAEGWTTDLRTGPGAGQAIFASKEKRLASVSLEEVAGQTSIQILTAQNL